MFRPLPLAAALILSAPLPLLAQGARLLPDAAADPAGFVQGVWTWDEATLSANLGPTESDVVIDYRPDGRYEMYGTLTIQADGGSWPITIKSKGTWEAEVGEPGHVLVTFDARNVVVTPDGDTLEDVVVTKTYEILDGGRVRDLSTGDIMLRS